MASHLRAIAAAVPLIVFRAATGGMPILMALLIAHQWGLEELAGFTVAHAAISVALVIADWGAMRALPRNLATLPRDAAAEFLASSNAFRLLLICAMLAVGGAAAAAGMVDANVVRYLTILFLLVPLFAMTTNAVSERVVVRETRGIGIAVISGLIVFAALAAVVLSLGLGPRWFVAAYVIAKVIEAIVLAHGRWWVLAVSATGMSSAALALVPFSAQMIMGVIYSRAAVFTVERLATRMELGVFSVAAALQAALMLIPASIALIHFPELTRKAHEEDTRGMRQILVRYTMVSGASVALGVVGLAVLAGPMSGALKVPRSFAPFVVIFAALAFLSIFSTILGFVMQARGEEAAAARLSLVTLSLALVYQITALSAFGLWGIVVAVAASEITTLVVFGLAVRRPRRPRPVE